jgi:hypothetical protein
MDEKASSPRTRSGQGVRENLRDINKLLNNRSRNAIEAIDWIIDARAVCILVKGRLENALALYNEAENSSLDIRQIKLIQSKNEELEAMWTEKLGRIYSNCMSNQRYPKSIKILFKKIIGPRLKEGLNISDVELLKIILKIKTEIVLYENRLSEPYKSNNKVRNFWNSSTASIPIFDSSSRRFRN